jgi:tetratricopeptide (TPR) repeat protein
VEFDSLSLNVSGDAYFSEGDLATAVREYQKGLDISADDVNLLNSLGVAYGLMNRTNDALRAFDRALEHDPDNFMALYNKGLGKLSQSDDAGAAKCFTRARLLCDRTDPDEAAVLEELEFQLGVCLFRQRKYRQAIEILENWNRSVKQDRVRSRSCRYLGIGYYRIGDLKLSSTWLQRAVHADEADAEALSLLGEVYVKTGQGNEIGLKLCEKSIELEPGNIGFHLRYGRVLSLCGHYTRSTEVLNRCFRTPSIRAEAWLEAAANGYRKGDAKEGEKYAVKVIKAGNITAALKSRAKTMLNENRV